MGLHHQLNHGRVFHGAEARQHLRERKRDSHGTEIKMNIPKDHPAHQKAAAARPADPAQKAHYKQAAARPADRAQIDSILAKHNTPNKYQDGSRVADNAASSSISDAEASYRAAKSAAHAGPTLPPGHDNKNRFLNPPTSAALPTTSSGSNAIVGTPLSHSPQAVVGTPLSATRGPESNAGMTGGAMAGMALGIIFGFALVAGVLFFCWRRKRNPAGHREMADNKVNSIDSVGADMSEKDGGSKMVSSHAASTAPRLALRPNAQFLPNVNDKRSSAGSTDSKKPKSMWERRSTNDPFADGQNAEEIDEKASIKSAKPNNVHRVQLDFKPSMDDELELTSGQLVRILHEYDDGWALCIRMDRSQQGVAPRTCLSKQPVKSRDGSTGSNRSSAASSP
ncbi:hypothetical protein K470DRAFT_263062 [Piedraia hortae CBS 480.64]|uniref:SH3 domain-containing protein n=1 Tax=Piedraia hortae CBS 480.64 TaxID=1314780 RepID=A0A6A7C4M6_9PEZI|nr:hypothetical protein K470DRAFT_263062 [Piedraia hortae CBS 480.64]